MNQVELQPSGELTAGTVNVADRPLLCLGHRLLLADGCTLRSYFHLIERNPIFSQINEFFPLLQSQYGQCPESRCIWPEYDSLQFSKTVEMIGYPGKPRLEIYHRLQGIGRQDQTEIRHIPLKALLDVPLALGPLKHLVFGDRMDAMTFETVYTLFEFIDGMAWALSFNGAPDQCLTRS